MGFNKARGYFIGEVCIHWKDGGIIRGKLPSGVLRGYLFGKYIFHPDGANYSYDPVNQIVCSYELVDKDVLRGCIGRLREREYPRFVMIVKHDAGSCKEKY